MRFESVRLTRSDAPVDVAAAEAWLESRPWAWRDPVHGKDFYLAGRVRSARSARDERLANPSEYSRLGVLVTVQPEGVGISQAGEAESMARARDFVAWLLRTGQWRMQGDLMQQSVPITSPDALYPDPLPSADELEDDPHLSPVLDGVITRWTQGGRTLSVHSGGAARLQLPGGEEADARLAPEVLEAWNSVSDLDPEALDFDAPDPATVIALDRETPEGEKSAWFGADRIPEPVLPLSQMVADLWSTLEGWSPGRPVPPGLVSIRRGPG